MKPACCMVWYNTLDHACRRQLGSCCEHKSRTLLGEGPALCACTQVTELATIYGAVLHMSGWGARSAPPNDGGETGNRAGISCSCRIQSVNFEKRQEQLQRLGTLGSCRPGRSSVCVYTKSLAHLLLLLPNPDFCEMATIANERDQEKFSSRLGSVWSESNRRQVPQHGSRSELSL